jgi:hypothetical protein
MNSTQNGPAVAAILAGGIGSAAMGLCTTIAEASDKVGNALNWWGPVGPLSGKSILAIIIWLVAWAILHTAWKGKDVSEAPVYKVAFILVAVGFLGTFPLVFDLF